MKVGQEQTPNPGPSEKAAEEVKQAKGPRKKSYPFCLPGLHDVPM